MMLEKQLGTNEADAGQVWRETEPRKYNETERNPLH